jgi:hypothetical protein
MNAAPNASSPVCAQPRYIKIGEDGALLSQDAAEWAAVLDTKMNLMWDVKARPVANFREAQTLPGTLKVAGFGDWRTPTVEELFLLADRSRARPPIDTDFFPDTPSDWFWSSTLWASSPSDCAWAVNFLDGDSLWSSRGFVGFVRAVRPGQS